MNALRRSLTLTIMGICACGSAGSRAEPTADSSSETVGYRHVVSVGCAPNNGQTVVYVWHPGALPDGQGDKIFKHLQGPDIEDCLSELARTKPKLYEALLAVSPKSDPKVMAKTMEEAADVWSQFGVYDAVQEVATTGARGPKVEALLQTCAGLSRTRQQAAAASGPSVRWPIPTGWKHETFALPPGFAPTLPYQGTEDLRFMPGFSSPTAPDNWSYVFVWWLDQPPPFDAASVAANLTTYFQGLATAVGGSKYHLDPARYHAVLTPVPASEPPRLTGQVFTYDPFATGLPITLNVEAELRSCPGTKQVAVVVALSPKDTTDSVWTSLRATAGNLVCN